MPLESPFGSDEAHSGLAAPFSLASVIGTGPVTDYSAPAGSVTGAASAPSTDVIGGVAGTGWSGLLKWLGVSHIADVIGLVLGLLLVAAGIFLFKPVREAATMAVKTAVAA
jgi:hypothetical protein